MRRVMVIDDHDRSRTQLVQTLRGSGYEIAGEGASGRAALALTQASAPDALLMAVGLGDSDGIDAARDLMQTKPLPIVLGSSPATTMFRRWSGPSRPVSWAISSSRCVMKS